MWGKSWQSGNKTAKRPGQRANREANGYPQQTSSILVLLVWDNGWTILVLLVVVWSGWAGKK